MKPPERAAAGLGNTVASLLLGQVLFVLPCLFVFLMKSTDRFFRNVLQVDGATATLCFPESIIGETGLANWSRTFSTSGHSAANDAALFPETVAPAANPEPPPLTAATTGVATDERNRVVALRPKGASHG